MKHLVIILSLFFSVAIQAVPNPYRLTQCTMLANAADLKSKAEYFAKYVSKALEDGTLTQEKFRYEIGYAQGGLDVFKYLANVDDKTAAVELMNVLCTSEATGIK